MICIVAEKPSTARDIAGTLGEQPKKHDGYLSVGPYVVTWAFGHLVTLAAPEVYNPTWKRWDWATLPMIPDQFQLVPVPKTQGQLKIIHRLMRQADTVICATDGDREGELIFRYIYRLADVQKPVDRLWLSETTPTAIQQALHHMKPLAAYDALAHAAEARAQADWLVGLNATRSITLQHGQAGHGALSVGRVQTPTLALIADREAAIAQFQPQAYWTVDVTFETATGATYAARWMPFSPAEISSPDREEHPERLTEDAARSFVQRLPRGTRGRIIQVHRQTVTVNPPLLFSLNDLQKEANKRLGLTAQQTLDVAQSLYEKHLTSYPRTESRYITQEIATTIPDRLAALPPTYAAWAQSATATAPNRLINDAKVAAAGHYAIIPTPNQGDKPALSDREQNVYDLIVRRFIAALWPAGQDERTICWTGADGETFRTQGSTVVMAGWRTVYASLSETKSEGDEKDNPMTVPAGLQAQDPVTLAAIEEAWTYVNKMDTRN